jgi:magnesium transporter
VELHALCRSPDGSWQVVREVRHVARLRRDPRAMVWADADVSDLSEADVRALAEEFDLDPLAVEDALDPRQRPKLETYPEHLFAIAYQLDEEADQLEPRQIAAFVGRGFAILLHQGADRIVAEARKRLRSSADGRASSADRALHVLLDAAVDDHERISDSIDRDIEELEAQAIELAREHERHERLHFRRRETGPSRYELYTLKQQLVMLRRFAVPMRAALERFLDRRGNGSRSEDETENLLRDVLDHLVRLSAQIRSADELGNGVLDLVGSVQADTLNAMNKKLSAWAAIVAAPALIVGLYGTNYKVLPGISGSAGFGFVLGLMAAGAGALFAFFKRRGWI